jgi:hypothetical protein
MLPLPFDSNIANPLSFSIASLSPASPLQLAPAQSTISLPVGPGSTDVNLLSTIEGYLFFFALSSISSSQDPSVLPALLFRRLRQG